MKQVIKITDIESGKELEIVRGYCHECFYYNNDDGCREHPYQLCLYISDLSFKEVTTKEEKK